MALPVSTFEPSLYEIKLMGAGGLAALESLVNEYVDRELYQAQRLMLDGDGRPMLDVDIQLAGDRWVATIKATVLRREP